MAVCSIASCTSDAPDSGIVSSDSEMRFTISDVTRASITTSNNITSKPFVVYGDMRSSQKDSTNPLFVIFNGTKVEYQDNNWNYESTQYWFPGYEYSFVTIYPEPVFAGLEEPQYSNSQLSFKYTLPDDFTDTSDLLATTHRRKYIDREQTPATPVSFKFFHIMSRLNFSLEYNGAADQITITKVELEGVNKTGTFTIIPAPLLSGSEQTDDYTFSWTDISDKSTLTTDVGIDVADGETRPLFPDDNALLVIPQPDNKDIIMKITYTFGNNTEAEEQTLTAQTPIGGWETGKIYSYFLTVNIIEEKKDMTFS
ncbi:MAG: fimbrillin family protein, partial [Prevotella sp.]|nr:fimbrillin family protein [Prevotella sp.]